MGLHQRRVGRVRRCPDAPGAGLAIPGAWRAHRRRPSERRGGRFFERHMAWRDRRLSRERAGPVRGRHQPGADARIRLGFCGRLVPLARRGGAGRRPSARASSQAGLRNRARLCERAASALPHQARRACDLRSRRNFAGRGLRHRADREPVRTAADVQRARLRDQPFRGQAGRPRQGLARAPHRQRRPARLCQRARCRDGRFLLVLSAHCEPEQPARDDGLPHNRRALADGHRRRESRNRNLSAAPH